MSSFRKRPGRHLRGLSVKAGVRLSTTHVTRMTGRGAGTRAAYSEGCRGTDGIPKVLAAGKPRDTSAQAPATARKAEEGKKGDFSDRGKVDKFSKLSKDNGVGKFSGNIGLGYFPVVEVF